MNNCIQYERAIPVFFDRIIARMRTRSRQVIALMVLLLLSCGLCARTSDGAYTPEDIGCNGKGKSCWLGDLGDPAAYRFTMYNGNWAPSAVLPFDPPADTALEVTSSAAWSSSIYYHDENGRVYLSFPFGRFMLYTGIKLHANDQYLFTSANDHFFYPSWYVAGRSVKYSTPNDSSSKIPGAPRLVVYQLWEGNWSQNIYLSDNAVEDQLVIVHSDAANWSCIYVNSMCIGVVSKGVTLAFKYVGHSWTWVDLTQN